MRTTLLSTLAMLVCLTSFAKERIVDHPVYTIRNNTVIECERIIQNDTATILEIHATFTPKYWIQIATDAYLSADGKQYPIRSGEGITPGEKFWMPESGKATFKLIFPPLPANTKEFDFFESIEEDNGWSMWGIRTDGKLPVLKMEKEWTADKMPEGSTLPSGTSQKGTGILTGRFIAYKPSMATSITSQVMSPYDNPSKIKLDIQEDGSFHQEIPLYGVSIITFSIGDKSYHFYMQPNQTTEILVNLPEIGRKSSSSRKDVKPYGENIYFKGELAGINKLFQQYKSIQPQNQEELNAFLPTIQGKTTSEYIAYCRGLYEQALAQAKEIKGITPAGIELLSLCLQNDMVQLASRGPYYMSQAYKKANGIGMRERLPKEYKYPRLTQEDYSFLADFNLNNPFYPNLFFTAQMLYYEGAFKKKQDPNGLFKYLVASGKLKDEETALLNLIIKDGYEAVQKQDSTLNPKMMKIRNTYDSLFQAYGEKMHNNTEIIPILKKYFGTDQGPLFSAIGAINLSRKLEDYIPLSKEDFDKLNELNDPSAVAYYTEKNQELINKIEKNKKKTGYSIAQVPNAPAEQLLDSIIARYPGKVIFIDFWATWCGPCKMAMKEAEPVKAALADKGIVYIYLAGENSPQKAWENMIPDIHGIHYRLSNEQWSRICDKYKVNGVPSYMIVGKDGKQVHFQVGFMGASSMKEMLIKEVNKAL